MHRRLSRWCLCALFSVSCQTAGHDTSTVFVAVDHPHLRSGPVRVEPEAAVEVMTRTPNRLIFEVHPDQVPDSLSIQLPEACPVLVSLGSAHAGETLTTRARPYLELGDARPELGFDAHFEIEVEAGCAEAAQGRIAWKQIEGVPLRETRSGRRGFEFSARTPKHSTLLPNPTLGKIVPVSPRSSGRAVLQATLELADGTRVRDEIAVSCVSRARGLPNVPVDASVLLGGEGWSWVRRPPGASATLSSDHGLSWFRPRVSGRWILADASGNELSMQSGSYVAMPLDCARGGCHVEQRFGTAGAMGTVMDRGLAGHWGPLYDPSCAVGCHTVGEAGLDDGGFSDVARQIGFVASADTLPSELPPTLQRLANVGCLACHGPGTIPEPSSRWSILAADVCAYCHDDPPRYDHVATWKLSGMSRADHDARARVAPECIGCHTTWGFLAEQGANEPTRQPPGNVTLGVACAACHDVHQHPATEALVRRRDPPPAARTLAPDTLGSSTICLGCHAPPPGEAPEHFPTASVTALFAGAGGFDRLGRELSSPGAHSSVDDGCLACHGEDHSFHASPEACHGCHAATQRDGSLQTRARALWTRLAERGAVLALPRAATHLGLGYARANSVEKRAAYNLSLVLLDSAADVHNPAYAALLLEEAEAMLRELEKGAE